MNYGVEAIPTLILFKKGQPVQRFQGIPAKARVQEALDAAKA
jgi:thioredoxin 1